ncbi:DUF1778 domain-containing protein [Winslowiella iniecta]|uniref:Toxin-antitoxin system, antitoxin component n=1 Tax=Winslowiella iniecta TaxID=1560201 RepID=A0A0L7SZ00_9GAMM|nr:DUF1778 domain-containing protein [Winslowiella iniecta]KOC88216.1 toxin-antitoxin system, antitoxin component [Winslowiella iniecta]KOC91167.1 toxin-antitoxin system, antitoxin component [Winslowiella iniecta]
MSALAKKERLELRVSSESKANIEAAAQISCISVSQFIAESALERAENIINEHRRIQLTEDAWQKVAQALDNPPAPNQRFRRAVERMSEDDVWKWDN